MAMLHTINKSPFEKNSLESCLRVARDGCAVLLIEDAVYAALGGTSVEADVRAALGRLELYALEPDLKARGLEADKLIDGIKLIDYDGFVDLTAAHDNVQSWL